MITRVVQLRTVHHSRDEVWARLRLLGRELRTLSVSSGVAAIGAWRAAYTGNWLAVVLCVLLAGLLLRMVWCSRRWKEFDSLSESWIFVGPRLTVTRQWGGAQQLQETVSIGKRQIRQASRKTTGIELRVRGEGTLLIPFAAFENDEQIEEVLAWAQRRPSQSKLPDASSDPKPAP